MLEYLYDFISLFFDKLKDSTKLRSIILFGSFARGNSRKDSDIDIFIDVEESNKKEIESIIRESLNEFELNASKSWHLKGIKNVIAPIIDDIYKAQWNELRKEIAINGVVLYGKYRGEYTYGKHSVLIEYELSKLKQKDKMKILRKLYGYTLKKRKKVYIQEGIVKEVKAEKLANVIVVDIEHHKKIVSFLQEKKIPIKVREVWIV